MLKIKKYYLNNLGILRNTVKENPTEYTYHSRFPLLDGLRTIFVESLPSSLFTAPQWLEEKIFRVE